MGTTDFREVAEFIDDDSDEERAQDSAEEPEPAAREYFSGGTAAGPEQAGEPEHFTLSPNKNGRNSPVKSEASHPEDHGRPRRRERGPAKLFGERFGTAG